MDLLIIVVNWNGECFIKSCIDSTLNCISLSKYIIKLVVVDNNSNDNSRNILKKYINLDIIYLENNVGFAAANNIALSTFKSRFYLLLNPDTVIPEKHSFDYDIEYMQSNTNVGIIGCKILNPDMTWQPSIGHYMRLKSGIIQQIEINEYLHSNKFTKKLLNNFSIFFPKQLSRFNKTLHGGNQVVEAECVLGAYFMFNAKLLELIGLLDESFFMFGEEIDFCKRAHDHNYKVHFVPYNEIIHIGKQSQKSVTNLIYFWVISSYFLYFNKHDKIKLIVWRIITLILQSFFFLGNLAFRRRINYIINKSLIWISLRSRICIIKGIKETHMKISELYHSHF